MAADGPWTLMGESYTRLGRVRFVQFRIRLLRGFGGAALSTFNPSIEDDPDETPIT